MNEQLLEAMLAVMDAKLNTERTMRSDYYDRATSLDALKAEKEAIEAARKLWREAP